MQRLVAVGLMLVCGRAWAAPGDIESPSQTYDRMQRAMMQAKPKEETPKEKAKREADVKKREAYLKANTVEIPRQSVKAWTTNGRVLTKDMSNRAKIIYVTVTGQLVRLDPATIYVKLKDGTERSLPRDELSKADQATVDRLEKQAKAKSKVVNLLEKIDPTRDSIQGEWNLEGKQLVSSNGPPNPVSPRGESADNRVIITIPYSLPEEYTLAAVVERRDGKSYFGIGLVIPPTRCMVAIDGNGWSGISFIDGQDSSQNKTTIHGQPIDQGKQHMIECTVRKAAAGNVNIVVHVDGMEIIDWTGSSNRLSMRPKVRHPVVKAGKEHYLWLQNTGGSFAVSKLELRLLDSSLQR